VKTHEWQGLAKVSAGMTHEKKGQNSFFGAKRTLMQIISLSSVISY